MAQQIHQSNLRPILFRQSRKAKDPLPAASAAGEPDLHIG
jgi:hypothetical protein